MQARKHPIPAVRPSLVVLINLVLVVVERELHKVPDPCGLSGLYLLLAGLVAQLLRGDVAIPPNKVLHAVVWPLIVVLAGTKAPSSPPSSLLSC